MGPVRYAILGTTQARRPDGSLVPLAGARLRALLAALALRPGQDVSPTLLIAEVWVDGPPADAVGALHALVARLRRVLGRDAVRSGPAGYRLAAEPADVDLGVFEHLVDQGSAALRAGEPDKAAALLRQALALWRGPALADLPDRAVAAAGPEEARLAATQQRIAADLALGRAAAVLPELRELVAARPLHEPLRVQLIQALRAAGRPADALAAYEDARRDLADLLGADPGVELRALHQELLNPPDVPSATAEPGPTRPPADRGRSTSPALRGAGRPGNLRTRLTSFVGREPEVAALRQDLTACRLVTLVGPGGSGKTRLAQEAALAQADRWPDGVWLVELASLGDPTAVPGAVLTALGLRETVLHSGTEARLGETAHGDPTHALVEHVARRELLLILDNCEHLIQAAADLAERLLTSCPGLSVLATSREPLGVPGEFARPVDPLPTSPAVQLFADRGAAVRPAFDPAGEPEAVEEICRRLDGLPLAIELAAARLRTLTPRQIADRLDDRFHLLTAGSRTALPRQQTLRAVVDWSWDLLSEPERVLLRRLSVFTGGCTLEAAESVCAGAGLDQSQVLDLLGSLVDKSLLIADLGPASSLAERGLPDAQAPAEMRYRMLETIHEYAAERLHEAGPAERADTTRRHIQHFRELTRRAAPLLRGPEQLTWLVRLETEHDNIRGALRRAVDGGLEDEALLLALGMSWFWRLRNYAVEATAWFETVATLGPDPLRDLDGPAPPVEQDPLEVTPPLPAELLLEARRQIALGRLVHREDRLEHRANSAAVELARRLALAYHPDLPQSSRLPGVVWPLLPFYTGGFGHITPQLEQAVAACRRRGHRWELAFCRLMEARVKADLAGKLSEAAAAAAESHELFTELGDRWGQAEVLSSKAEITEFNGDPDGAQRLYREAIALARTIGAHQEAPFGLVRIGQIELGAGRLEAAERLVREGIAEGMRLAGGAWDAVIFGRLILAVIRAHRGDLAEAGELVRESIAEADLGSPPPVMYGLLYAVDGWIAARGGHARQGLDRVRAASARLLGGDSGPAIAGVLRAAAYTLVRTAQLGDGDAEHLACQAAQMLGAYARFSVPAPGVLDLTEEREVAQAARELLGVRRFDAERAHGRALTAREAILTAAGLR